MSRGAPGFDGKDEIDFAVGSVTGVRVWKLQIRPQDAPVIVGQNGYKWTDGENVAACSDDRHQPPADGCGCGFWAYWDMNAALVFKPGSWAVVGVIEGYGRTVIGERGFRSARARIVALCLAVSIYAEDRGVGGWRDALSPGKHHPDEFAIKAEAEDRLGLAYPSAQIRMTQENLLALHPTTKDYLPESEPVPEAHHDTGWAPVGVNVTLTARQQHLLQNWPGRIYNS